MRTIALSVTVCGLVIAVSGISVGGDFDALLEDLTFGDAPSIEQPEPLNVTVDQAAETLKPAPEGFLLPAPNETSDAPLTALKDPVPVVEAQTETNAEVDFNEMFGSEGLDESDAALSAPLVALKPITDSQLIGHRLPADCVAQPQCDSCGMGHSHGHHVTCIPYTRPNLPSSTFYQYFRSSRCNTRVWDGYQQKCGLFHDCVTGNCDCFSHGKSAGCTSCDSCE